MVITARDVTAGARTYLAEGGAGPRGDGGSPAPRDPATAPIPSPAADQLPASRPAANRRHGTAEEWPLESFLELDARPGSVPRARLHARKLLPEWGPTELSENVELLVSELVTNAVNAAQSMQRIFPVRLSLLSDGAQVLILVWDANPRPPELIATGEEAESGRGLLLVETISARWDWYFPPAAGGKVVWALPEMH